ncbi:hypothetical protein [Streptomyces sp.]|uniref:hypothetical protein n=1 Tax=Streptomyces sp. TaxID=1931 RepID=UPI002810E38D|nr:hypothetical protein [Streptomyces sp.]
MPASTRPFGTSRATVAVLVGLVLALLCGGSAVAATGPVPGVPPLRAQPVLPPAPYELSPAEEREPTAAHRGGGLRDGDRRRATGRPAALRAVPYPAVTGDGAVPEPAVTRAPRRHPRAGPLPSLTPSALQVFRC